MRRCRSAMTLAETLVALAIAAGIIAVVTTSVLQVAFWYRSDRQERAIQHQLDFGMQTLARDIEAASEVMEPESGTYGVKSIVLRMVGDDGKDRFVKYGLKVDAFSQPKDMPHSHSVLYRAWAMEQGAIHSTDREPVAYYLGRETASPATSALQFQYLRRLDDRWTPCHLKDGVDAVVVTMRSFDSAGQPITLQRTIVLRTRAIQEGAR